MTDRIARPQHPAPRSITCISMTPERLPSASIQKNESCRIHQGPSLQADAIRVDNSSTQKSYYPTQKKTRPGGVFLCAPAVLRTPNLRSKTSRLLSLAYFQSVSALTQCVSLSLSLPSASLSLSLSRPLCLFVSGSVIESQPGM